MASLGELVVKLNVDSGNFQRGIDSATGGLREVGTQADKTENAVRGLGERLSTAGQKMAGLGHTLSIGVTLPLVAAGGAALKLAVDAEETAAKFNTVLGPAAGRVRAEIERLTGTIPATREQLQSAVADMTALGKATGLTTEQASAYSLQLVQAAADMASFNNVPMEQALLAIRSALVGQSEPMLRFGVDTRKTTLEQVALREGLLQAGQEMTAQTQTAAILAAIHHDAADAMGDAARTAESTANQLKFLKRDTMELATSIGQQLVPIIRPMIELFAGWLERMNHMSPATQSLVVGIGLLAAAAGPVLFIVGTMIEKIGILITTIKGWTVATAGAEVAQKGLITRLGAFAIPAAAVGVALAEVKRNSDDSASSVEKFLAKLTPIGPLSASIKKNADNWDELAQSLGINETVANKVGGVFDWLTGETEELSEAAVAQGGLASETRREWEHYGKQLAALGPIGDRIRATMQNLAQQGIDSVRNALAAAGNQLASFMGLANNMFRQTQQLKQVTAETAEEFNGAARFLSAFGIEVAEVATMETSLATGIDKTTGAAKSQKTAVDEGTKAVQAAIEALQGELNQLKGVESWELKVAEATRVATAAQREQIAAMMDEITQREFQAEALETIEELNKQAEETEQKRRETVQGMIADLEKSLETHALNSVELAVYEARQAGATEAEIERIRSLATMSEEMDKQAEASAEHARKIEEMKERMGAAFGDFFDRLLPDYSQKWETAWGGMGGIFGEFVDIIKDLIYQQLGKAFEKLLGWLAQAIGLSPQLTSALGLVTTAANTATAAVATTTTTIATAMGGTAATGAGVVGVGGTAGGLSTGVGIPTIGGATGTAGGTSLGAVAGGAAGAGIALGGPVALSFLGEALMGLLGRDPGLVFEDTDWYAGATEYAPDWFAKTGYQPGALTGDYSAGPDYMGGPQAGYYNPPKTVVLEVDGRVLGEVAFDSGVESARIRAGITAY